MVIRPANAGDREDAQRLLTAQLVEHRLPADAEGIARGIELALARAWLWLAELEGETVAVFLANEIVSVEKGGLVLWVEELYVAPGARRRGAARALLARVVEEARRKQVRAVVLEVVPALAAALALWRALGFALVDRRRMSL